MLGCTYHHQKLLQQAGPSLLARPVAWTKEETAPGLAVLALAGPALAGPAQAGLTLAGPVV
jgi:hypothetical protein